MWDLSVFELLVTYRWLLGWDENCVILLHGNRLGICKRIGHPGSRWQWPERMVRWFDLGKWLFSSGCRHRTRPPPATTTLLLRQHCIFFVNKKIRKTNQLLHLLHSDVRIIKFKICEKKLVVVVDVFNLSHSTAQSQLEKLINCAVLPQNVDNSNTSHWHLLVSSRRRRNTMKQMDERRMHLLLPAADISWNS